MNNKIRFRNENERKIKSIRLNQRKFEICKIFMNRGLEKHGFQSYRVYLARRRLRADRIRLRAFESPALESPMMSRFSNEQHADEYP